MRYAPVWHASMPEVVPDVARGEYECNAIVSQYLFLRVSRNCCFWMDQIHAQTSCQHPSQHVRDDYYPYNET
jgi:hypothetical protein